MEYKDYEKTTIMQLLPIVMTSVKQGMNFKRILSLLVVFIMSLASYAQKTVTGNVRDVFGEPMIGVNILVEGANKGVVTNIQGDFTIDNVSDNTVLKFSYIGFRDQKVVVDGNNIINVIMHEDATALNEVVVVGYGTMKKKDLTGSVATVNINDIAMVTGSDVLQALQARVPGVDLQQEGGGEAGAGVNITLRGNRSLKASNAPLVIVDGVEYGTTLDIPASAIEMVDILKDAASTAIYGSKGANGVILITTKRGTVGKTMVTFSGYMSFNSATGVIKPMYGDKEVQRLIDKKIYENAAVNNWKFDNNVTAADVLTLKLSDGTETLSIYNDKSYTDWMDIFMQNSSSQNYELSINGGGEKTNFNFSLAAMNDNGLMKDDSFNRYTGRINFDHKLNSIAKVGGNFSYVYKSNDKRNGNVYEQAQKMTTITHAYLNDGTINATPNPWYVSHCSPLLDENGNYQRNVETTRFFGSIYADISPIKGLSIKSQFTLDRSDVRDGSYQDFESQSRWQSGQTSIISNARSSQTKYVWQNTANFNKVIGRHDFTFLLGHEMMQSVKESLEISGSAGADHFNKSSFYDVTKIENPNKSSSYTKASMISFFSRLNYSFKDKYLFQTSIRADGASVLADGHKWGYFPSVSAGWRISEENFMHSSKSWLDNLKLRVSFGLSGNAAIDAYQTLAYISSIVPNSTEKAPMTMAAPELTWEKTTALDFGIDFSMFNGRIYGSIDYYKSHTYDLLYYRTAPPSSVFTSTLANVGKTKGHGWEVSIGLLPVKTKNFTWDIGASATFSRDYVEELTGNLQEYINGIDILRIGEPVLAYYTYKVDGCWNIGEFDEYMRENPNFIKPFATYGTPGTSKAIDVNNDNKINEADKVIYNRSPKAIIGLSTSLTYKDFSISIMTMARLGWYLSYDGYKLFRYDDANWGDISYWTPENTGALIPSPGATSNQMYFANAIWMQKGDYFKIKDITLSYNLPKALLKPTFMSSARVYFSLKNYFTFSHFDNNYDPERGGSVDFPIMKQAVIGVNLTF